jgi:hypothetical protein
LWLTSSIVVFFWLAVGVLILLGRTDWESVRDFMYLGLGLIVASVLAQIVRDLSETMRRRDRDDSGLG